MWAVFFLKHWRRYEAALTWRWNVDDFSAEEPIRAAFYRHPATRHDRKGFYTREAGFMPLGEAYTPYFPRAERRSRVLRAAAATGVLMGLSAVGTLSLFALRLAVSTARSIAFELPLYGGYVITRATLASFIASVLNTLFITAFNGLYRAIGVRLVEWQVRSARFRRPPHAARRLPAWHALASRAGWCLVRMPKCHALRPSPLMTATLRRVHSAEPPVRVRVRGRAHRAQLCLPIRQQL